MQVESTELLEAPQNTDDVRVNFHVEPSGDPLERWYLALDPEDDDDQEQEEDEEAKPRRKKSQ